MIPPKTPIWPKTTPDYMLCIWRDIHDHCNSPVASGFFFCPHPSSCASSEQPDCPFCNFRRLTSWYLCDTENNIVACEDLQPKQYSYRILVVGFGKDWHVSWDKLPFPKQDILTRYLFAIAKHHLAIGQCGAYIKIDYAHSYPAHAHLQACMMTHRDHDKFVKQNPDVLQQFVGQDPGS